MTPNDIKDLARWAQATTVLQRARLILSAGFWGKGSYSLKHRFSNRNSQEYAYCALGALHKARALLGHSNVFTASSALDMATWGDHVTSTIDFNDDPATTLEDVLAIYDNAIDYAQTRTRSYQ